MFGASGVGKTHLASAFADSLIQHGIRAPFAAATDLVQQLQRACSQHCLDQALNKLDRFAVLLLDDIGYVKKYEAELSGCSSISYSTVTLLARLRGWSTSVPLITAT